MARTKKMMRKLKYRLKKGIPLKSKKMMARRWIKLVKSPRSLEVKQNFTSFIINCLNQTTPANDLPAVCINGLGSIWPTQSLTDSGRIGDSLNVKSMSYQILLKQNTNYNQQFVRVIFFTNPKDVTVGTSFFKFGASSISNHGVLNSVDRENYNVISDKIYQLSATGVTNIGSVPLKSVTGMKLIRGTIMRNQRVEFANNGIVPKNPKHRLYVAAFSCIPSETDQSNTAFAYITTKLNFSD